MVTFAQAFGPLAIAPIFPHAGYRHTWFHLRWHTNRCPSSHRGYLCCRLLQTRFWGDFYLDHNEQEFVGLRRLTIHHSMGAKGG